MCFEKLKRTQQIDWSIFTSGPQSFQNSFFFSREKTKHQKLALPCFIQSSIVSVMGVRRQVLTKNLPGPAGGKKELPEESSREKASYKWHRSCPTKTLCNHLDGFFFRFPSIDEFFFREGKLMRQDSLIEGVPTIETIAEGLEWMSAFTRRDIRHKHYKQCLGKISPCECAFGACVLCEVFDKWHIYLTMAYSM